MKGKIVMGILLYFFIAVVSCVNAQSSIKITLLGTGAPVPSIERFGSSILIEAGGQILLVDCGRGAGQRLWQLKIPLGQVDDLFLTNLHSDLVVGKDLLSIEIDDQVKVLKYTGLGSKPTEVIK